MRVLAIHLYKNLSRSRKRQLLYLFLLSLFVSFFELFGVGAIAPFLSAMMDPSELLNSEIMKPYNEYFSINNSRKIILYSAIIFVFINVFTNILKFILLSMQSMLVSSIGSDISVDLYQRCLNRTYLDQINTHSGEVANLILNKSKAVANGFLFPAISIFNNLLIIVLISSLIFISSPLASIAIVSVYGLAYLIISKLNLNTIKIEGEIAASNDVAVYRLLIDSMGGVRDIIIDGIQTLCTKIYSEKEYSRSKAAANILILSSRPRLFIESLTIILFSFFASLLAISKKGIADDLPYLAMMATAALRIIPLLQQIFYNWSLIKSSETSLQEVLSYLQKYKNKSEIISTYERLVFDKFISISCADFAYPKNTKSVLKNINFKIAKGSKIGIIGSTGSGKSTLLDILMGLIIPNGGFLEVDGIKITEKNSRSWQRIISHVPQNIFLTDNTIAANIAFGVPEADIDYTRVKSSAEKAQLGHMIEQLESKYRTMVGERGVRLSGGERQRVGLARAFYKDADILILDEATSALDLQTESRIINAINKSSKDLTLIMVAHRLSTLASCEKIYEITDGQISSIWTYDELINRV